eukprot:1153682-Pelagomonas_calceolata.AAC.1
MRRWIQGGGESGRLGAWPTTRPILVGTRAEFKFNEVNVPVLRRDLGRIKVGRSAWDRAYKDSIRMALVPGRGASTIRKSKTGTLGELGTYFREFYALFQESCFGRHPY